MTIAGTIEPRSGPFTAVLALELLGPAASIQGVEDQARPLWRERPKGRFVVA
jgi:hypothetical protein